MIIPFKEQLDHIFKYNPHCLIAGSIALKLQGFNIRREPSDIDIEVIPNLNFNPEGLEEGENSEEHYEREYTTYLLDGVKINVWNSDVNYQSEKHFDYRTKITRDILAYKVIYSLGEFESSEKHKLDIIYFINNNKNDN